MACDRVIDDLPLPDLEAVYRIAAARVTQAVRQGRVEAALRWGRILNLALRDRQMRARLAVTAEEVSRGMRDRDTASTEAPCPTNDAPPPSQPLHCLHPVFEPAPDPADPPSIDRRRTFREGRRR